MGELAKIDSFRKELAIAETFKELKLIGDAGQQYAEFLKKQKIGKEGINNLGRFLIEVEERKGEWLNDKYPHGLNAKYRGVAQGETPNMPVSPKESTKARTIANLEPEEKEIIYKELEEKDEYILPNTVYREYRKKQNINNREKVRQKYAGSQPPEAKKKYRIIYADPPWMYDKGKELSDKYGDVQKHYPPMETEDICGLPIQELAEKNCVLFLWVTAPKLPEGLQVMNSWGFQYKTCVVWDKIKHNYGFYFSVRHELLLIGGIGSSTPDIKKLHDSVISIERSDRHSEKPEYFRDLIDSMYIEGSRIELFARKSVAGWDNWGNEL